MERWYLHTDDGTGNIDALKNQKLPMVVECQACVPTKRQKRKFGTTYTVPEHSWITINPEIGILHIPKK